MEFSQSYYSSPIGLIEITAEENGITSVLFAEKENKNFHSSGLTEQCALQLQEYFEGSRKDFSLTLYPSGTDFQKKIWEELQRIPFGKTISYSEMARKFNTPSASRAIGHANSKNTLLIVLPCHRVIGQNGDLTGYAGELWRKKWLLEHELKLSGAPEQLQLFR